MWTTLSSGMKSHILDLVDQYKRLMRSALERNDLTSYSKYKLYLDELTSRYGLQKVVKVS